MFIYIYIYINQRNLYLRGDTTWWSFAWKPRSCQWLHASDLQNKTRITRITRSIKSIKYPALAKNLSCFFFFIFCVVVSHFCQVDFWNTISKAASWFPEFGSKIHHPKLDNWTCKHCHRPCCCWSIIRGGCWSQARSYGFSYGFPTWHGETVGASWSFRSVFRSTW